MQDLRSLNSLPISQLAKKKLLQAKQEPDPTALYPRQLLTWALASGTLKTDPEVEDQIGQMLQWSPAAQVTNLALEGGVPTATSDNKLEPKEVAWLLLDQIESLQRMRTS